MKNRLRMVFAAVLLLLFCAACGGEPGRAASVSLEQDSLSSASMSESSSVPLPESSPASAESESSVPAPESGSSVPVPESVSAAPESSVAPAVSSSTAPAELRFTADTVSPKQGGLVILTVENLPAGVLPTAVTDLNYTPAFFMTGESAASALLPVRSGTAVGDYTATVTAGEASQTFTVSVGDADFTVQYFEMDETVAGDTLNNTQAADEFEALYQRMKSAEDAVYWTGAFQLPVKQETLKISSNFGDTRYVNNQFSGRHGGVDFPAPQGTPVTATNDGKVAFAGFMTQTGNTVCIEHGMGLKSWYFHMDSLSCKTGDSVAKGEEIGRVGTTGASTGNHLHFAFSVCGVYVNPWLILEDGVTVPADSE